MDFIALTPSHWEDPWVTQHQIMSRLARKHKVLFVSPPCYIGQFRPEAGTRFGLLQRSENLYTYAPPPWLFESQRFPRITSVLAEVRRRKIKNIAAKRRFGPLALMIFHPRYAQEMGRFGERFACYYVYDDFAEYAGTSSRQQCELQQQEDWLLRKADVVLATGPKLFEAKNVYGNAVNVPNGVDFEFFSRAQQAETAVPGDLNLLPQPRIGYIGSVNDKVDYQLLQIIAAAFPKGSIVFVGGVGIRVADNRAQFQRLREASNVFVLGHKALNELPNYLKGLDVCLMPYRSDNWGASVSPLKLHEYLAGGKPVVSANIAAVREFGNVVRIARNGAEWISAIEESLAADNIAEIAARLAVARENTWDKRVELIERIIEEKAQQKRSTVSELAVP